LSSVEFSFGVEYVRTVFVRVTLRYAVGSIVIDAARIGRTERGATLMDAL